MTRRRARLEEVSTFSARCIAMRLWPGKAVHAAIFVLFLRDTRPACLRHARRFFCAPHSSRRRDREIDRLAYALYGLTEEEIRVVEEVAEEGRK
jgi:hypothetical protein